ncbi:MAG: hypothetical protein M1835_002599 [Candelina submexicana]|nr:MAG: hypothetical protein M1835_002599 [Candelina submexicana]
MSDPQIIIQNFVWGFKESPMSLQSDLFDQVYTNVRDEVPFTPPANAQPFVKLVSHIVEAMTSARGKFGNSDLIDAVDFLHSFTLLPSKPSATNTESELSDIYTLRLAKFLGLVEYETQDGFFDAVADLLKRNTTTRAVLAGQSTLSARLPLLASTIIISDATIVLYQKLSKELSRSKNGHEYRPARLGRRNAFDDLLEKVKTDQNFRNEVKQARTSVHLYDRYAPSVRAARASVLKRFLAFSKEVLVIDGVFENDVVESVVYKDVFKKDNIIDLVCQYLAAIVMNEDTDATGRVGEKIKVGTIRKHASAIWFTTQWECKDSISTLYPTWCLTVSNLCHKLAVENDLSTEKRQKSFYGVIELQLLFSRLQQKTTGFFI